MGIFGCSCLLIAIFAGLMLLVVFTAVFKLDLREFAPLKNLLGIGGDKCFDWNNAPKPDYKEILDKVEQRTDIDANLLGAILLSEHPHEWPNNDPYNWHEKDGPFQITDWSAYWQQALAEGVTGGKQQGSNSSMEDAATAVAASFRVAFKKYNIPLNTTDQRYITYAGMWHNRGQGPATEWANNGFDLQHPPENKKNSNWAWGATAGNSPGFAIRTWINFQNLGQGCQSVSATDASAAGGKIVAAAKKEINNTDMARYGSSFVQYVYKQASYDIDISSGIQKSPNLNWYPIAKSNSAEIIKPGDIYTTDLENKKPSGIVSAVDKAKKTLSVVRRTTDKIEEKTDIAFDDAGAWIGVGRLK